MSAFAYRTIARNQLFFLPIRIIVDEEAEAERMLDTDDDCRQDNLKKQTNSLRCGRVEMRSNCVWNRIQIAFHA